MTATRADLVDWVLEALKANGGQSEIVPICRHIWHAHRAELEASGDLFYTWQYDMRWAGTRLRQRGLLVAADTSDRGVWELKN